MARLSTALLALFLAAPSPAAPGTAASALAAPDPAAPPPAAPPPAAPPPAAPEPAEPHAARRRVEPWYLNAGPDLGWQLGSGALQLAAEVGVTRILTPEFLWAGAGLHARWLPEDRQLVTAVAARAGYAFLGLEAGYALAPIGGVRHGAQLGVVFPFLLFTEPPVYEFACCPAADVRPEDRCACDPSLSGWVLTPYVRWLAFREGEKPFIAGASVTYGFGL